MKMFAEFIYAELRLCIVTVNIANHLLKKFGSIVSFPIGQQICQQRIHPFFQKKLAIECADTPDFFTFRKNFAHPIGTFRENPRQ